MGAVICPVMQPVSKLPYVLAAVTTCSRMLHYSSAFCASATNMLRPLAANHRDRAQRIVWVDLEMTGLDVEKDRILEIACLVTDSNLNVVATGPDIIIHQPDEILNNMGDWCIAHHGASGLTQASKNSKTSLVEAEKEVLKFIKLHVAAKKCPLGGNSVYMDRLFIKKYMPVVDSYLHYRIIDVSSIKELAKRWYRSEYSGAPQKKFKHRALDDILDSIDEMKYYKENIFK